MLPFFYILHLEKLKQGGQKKIFFLFLFLQKSPFSDYTVLAQHSFTETSSGGGGKNKGGETKRSHQSQLVLAISNWHFVRDSLNSGQPRPCQPADCSVAIKLASSVFKPVGIVPSQLPGGSTDSSQFYFDRNGVSTPYEAFVSLSTSAEFKTYLTQVKSRFEQEWGPLDWTEHEQDPAQELEDAEAQEAENSPPKKVKKSQKKTG